MWIQKITRDLVMFGVGLLIAVHEVIIVDGERPYVLTLAGALMGLPFVIRLDERKNGQGK